MRSLLGTCLVFAALAQAAPVNADPPPPPANTVVAHDDIDLVLPGRWLERKTTDGYELRREQEQVVIRLFPSLEELDEDASLEKLSTMQRKIVTDQCKRGTRVGGIDHQDLANLRSVRTHIECDEPKVVATLVAGVANGRVISYEQYRYGVSTQTPEMQTTSAAIVDSIKLKPPVGTCPSAVLSMGKADGRACLEAAVLGAEAVASCVRELDARHWIRDDATASSVNSRTGKTVVCYRYPVK